MKRLHYILSILLVTFIIGAWTVRDSGVISFFTGSNSTPTIQANTNGSVILGTTGNTNAIAVNGPMTWTNTSTTRTNLGLGTIATQNSNSVSITGGSVTGITDLAVADGGTGASTAANARTNLGLGTIATQSSSSVSITGGSITGITDLAIADGGTGASTAAAAKDNLGLGTVLSVEYASATNCATGGTCGAALYTLSANQQVLVSCTATTSTPRAVSFCSSDSDDNPRTCDLS